MRFATWLLACSLFASGFGCVQIESFDPSTEYPVNCEADPPPSPNEEGCWPRVCMCALEGCGGLTEGEVCCYSDPDDPPGTIQVETCIEGRCGAVLCYSPP